MSGPAPSHVLYQHRQSRIAAAARRAPGSGPPQPPSGARLAQAALARAEAALGAAFAALLAEGRPLPHTRAALAGAYADIWACGRLNHAAERDEGAAVVAPYLGPRLLLDGADGLASVLGGRGRPNGAPGAAGGPGTSPSATRPVREPSPREPSSRETSVREPSVREPFVRKTRETVDPVAAHRHHVRALEALATVPGVSERIRAVTARLPLLADGADRLARPLVSVPLRALPRALGAVVGLLEEERQVMVGWARAQAAGDAEAGDPAAGSWVPPGQEGRSAPGPWALADRYALLTAVAAGLDGWRMPGAGRRGPVADRGCLIAALDRLGTGLTRRRAVPEPAWRDDVYAVAASTLGPAGAAGGAARQPYTRLRRAG